uniref:Uncharacterized protein n=1 Tax=Phasianus colchicus TaxID=9054 RepID=A0A669P7Z9_PHACC
GPAVWSQQPHASLQIWGRVAGKLCRGKGSGGAEHEPAHNDSSHTLCAVGLPPHLLKTHPSPCSHDIIT